jgi:hypothetical protein
LQEGVSLLDQKTNILQQELRHALLLGLVAEDDISDDSQDGIDDLMVLVRSIFQSVVQFRLDLLTSEVLALVVRNLSQEEELQLQAFPLTVGNRGIHCLHQMVDLL